MKSNLKKGFTLIELLIVVVIIGILAAIAIPKFATTKEKAYLAAMKTDLRNLVTAEEAYASSNAGAYFSASIDNSAGTATASNGYLPSSGVTITATASGSGWHATATHASATGHTCAIYINETTATSPATAEGEPKCN